MGILRSQFRDAPEKRVQFILYLMLGLLGFFVMDYGNVQSANRTKTLKQTLEEIQFDIQAQSAMIEQIPTLRKEIKMFEEEYKSLQAVRQQRMALLLACREQMLLDVLRGESPDRNPLQEFRLQEGASGGVLAQYLYRVELKGSYQEMIALLRRLDESPCRHNISHWILTAEDEDGDTISGSLFFRLYRESVPK
ncbi:MAG TPA: hypothetical protein PK395_20880 [bacterium]|nr:hypothetical protein [bacterium]